MEKYRYAVFTMKKDIDKTRKQLKNCGLEVVSAEETTPAYALCCFGIWPTADVVKKLPETLTVFVEGTERSFQRFCTKPENDVGEYWSLGA